MNFICFRTEDGEVTSYSFELGNIIVPQINSKLTHKQLADKTYVVLSVEYKYSEINDLEIFVFLKNETKIGLRKESSCYEG